MNLETGATDWFRVIADSGMDPEDELVKQAVFYGVTPEEMRTIVMIRNLPQHVIPFAVELISRGELLPEEPEPVAVPTQETPEVPADAD